MGDIEERLIKQIADIRAGGIVPSQEEMLDLLETALATIRHQYDEPYPERD